MVAVARVAAQTTRRGGEAMLDLLIRGGMVVDGSGAPARRADVAVQGDRIEAVETLNGARAAREIDAGGLAVSPGFIDTHAHTDVMLLGDPQHAGGLCQGVTTEILGQDGLSYAPLSPANLQLYRRYLSGLNGDPNIAWDWSSVAEYRHRFDRTVAINTAYLVPHGAVRLEVLGMRDAPLVGEPLKQAQALIARGMEEWAVGFATGLSYFPGSYSDTDELVALCRPVAERGGVYVTHLRTVFRGEPFDPVLEALEIGRRAGVKVHFSHFRTNAGNAGKVTELLATIDRAKAEGQDITLETYPYPTGSSHAAAFLPPWAQEGTPDEIVARLREPGTRARILEELGSILAFRQVGSGDDMIFTHLPSARNRGYIGLTLAETARRRGQGQAETLCDLLVEEELEVGYLVAPPGQDVWEQVNRDIMSLFARPDYTVGSDAIWAGEQHHPRAYGCFARLLGRFRRQYGGVSLEALVNRASGLAAERFGLKDRGLLAPGKAADVVVFDPERLEDVSTYGNPRRLAVGVEYVLVNGQVAVNRGKPTGVLAGRPIP
jgi:N-acyl-D-amino-acid deacylase